MSGETGEWRCKLLPRSNAIPVPRLLQHATNWPAAQLSNVVSFPANIDPSVRCNGPFPHLNRVPRACLDAQTSDMHKSRLPYLLRSVGKEGVARVRQTVVLLPSDLSER